MSQRLLCILSIIIMLMSVVLAGCNLRTVPTVNYFSLSTLEQMDIGQSAAAQPEIALGVGPVTIPDSLKRSQIVTRLEGNQYQFDEFNRWAGVLEKDIATVTGENLGMLLGIEKIGYFPWMSPFVPTYRVMLEIQRFDGALNGQAVLEARWLVTDTDSRQLLASGRSVFQRKLAGPDYAALVEAESLLLADLSEELAAVLQQLMTKNME